MTLRSTACLLLCLVAAGCASRAPIDVPVYEGKPLGHWLEEMKDLSKDRRGEATMAVMTFGEEAAPFLASMLQDGRPHVRKSAAYALARMGSRARPAASALLVALEDPDPGIREEAWGAVWNLAEVGIAVPGVVEAKARSVGMEADPGMRAACQKDLDAYRLMLSGQPKKPEYIER